MRRAFVAECNSLYRHQLLQINFSSHIVSIKEISSRLPQRLMGNENVSQNAFEGCWQRGNKKKPSNVGHKFTYQEISPSTQLKAFFSASKPKIKDVERATGSTSFFNFYLRQWR